jgi:hypothetical protein
VIVNLPVESNGHQWVRDGHAVDVIKDNGVQHVMGHHHGCVTCGEGLKLEITETAAVPKEPCLFPDGITTKIVLKVPSGKIVVEDDLRPLYDGFNDHFASYNTDLGQAQVVKAYEKQGCAYGPVGNSCPGLYRTGEDTYVIASQVYVYDDEDDEEDKGHLPDGWECLASICTDLWAYSIADYDDWVSKGGTEDDGSGTACWSGADIVEIPAGEYEFTHHTGERGFDSWADGPVIFAHIRKTA